ncbi:MAG: OmpA family protein [Candidatus Thiodiazotropha sp. (ex. Lucinisca nassula)]|nr:OmpA family protein [Candidatus Thiodiazotropha sp. (ex. Lucinisca nassula)]MBW9260003.1 OmpA family protein [Candidatus Thiodiazotropha sp. (ex. Lucinisca nassula)]MBW9271886.1 OmpA family protein [Candidatus Thiodiazotropha sp. (ex. Lucinisca nassula)]
MKKHLIIVSLAGLLLQTPVFAQEEVETAPKAGFYGSLLGMLAGGLLGGPPGAVLGFTSGAVIGDLHAENEELELASKTLPESQSESEFLLAQAHTHQQQFQQHQDSSLLALQEGFSFCLGFRTGSSRIEPKMAEQLNSLAEMLKAFPQFQLLVEAGADQRGTEAFNHQLSRKRAEAVASMLIDAGLSSERIKLRYQGESAAIYPLTDVEGLAFDRMVQLTLLHGDAS